MARLINVSVAAGTRRAARHVRPAEKTQAKASGDRRRPSVRVFYLLANCPDVMNMVKNTGAGFVHALTVRTSNANS